MKAKKKLFLAVGALVASLAISVSATFAWFTMNSEVSVSDVKVDVTSDVDGVEIAYAKGAVPNTGDYKYNLTLTGTEFAETKLSPVTSADGKAFKDISDTTASSGYLEFNLYFRSTKALKIAVDPTKSEVKSEAGSITRTVYAWKGITANEYGTSHVKFDKGEPITGAEAANAVRLSFAGAAGTTAADADAAAPAATWEPNATAGFSKAGTNLALDYYNFMMGTTIDTTGKTIVTTTADIAKAAIVDLTGAAGSDGYIYGVMTVRIWLEGFDGDCINSIAGQKLTAKLSFKAAEAA